MDEPFKLSGTDLFYSGYRVGVIFEPPSIPATIYEAMKLDLLDLRYNLGCRRDHCCTCEEEL